MTRSTKAKAVENIERDREELERREELGRVLLENDRLNDQITTLNDRIKTLIEDREVMIERLSRALASLCEAARLREQAAEDA